jgi:hypothetical protein
MHFMLPVHVLFLEVYIFPTYNDKEKQVDLSNVKSLI